ncbi:DUF4336 domain-containing protein [Synechococcales cyanobacterium C]|uniref:DUF4336 domain-containing protein n=1 Tax=Petrachloros mirabilis ULC683 TaxID=2781853 RepID=A0A8K2A035_9CYAN|nr:DUF4336 domain-containing protein [Petrachloros mirabilis]NCJ06892.1 DUF4336 domain-containing protein [Petrachloros mirabilis ULC683]
MEENQVSQTHHQQPTNQPRSRDWSWPLWPLLPLYPYGQRQTLCREILPNTLWVLEQVQGILAVIVPIRMTVIKLTQGGLLVYAPIAPTRECLRLMQGLVAAHGPVKYIILPTTSGLEHKVFVGSFGRRFPQAQIYVSPHQWSFPLNLPLSWLGLPSDRTHVLPPDSQEAPFNQDFSYAILGSIDFGLGSFAEVAFFHVPSCTLLLTDLGVSVPEFPPPIVQQYPAPLLYHAKDHALDSVEDTEANRRKGWQRIALFAFYFQPSALEVVPFGQSLRDARKAPVKSRQNYFGWFPFCWRSDWPASFEALHQGGRLFVAPILQKLILNRAPEATLNWVQQVASWNFERVIPCHLAAPIAVNPPQFQQAFNFLKRPNLPETSLPKSDFACLERIEARLIQQGILPSTPHLNSLD